MELTGYRKELDKGARDSLEAELRNPMNPKKEPHSVLKVVVVAEVLLSWKHLKAVLLQVHERPLLLVLVE